jgi:hypothetical protein
MSQLKKNLILEGVFGSEVPDTSGEILDIAGADISELKSGKALVNTEHISPKDIEKADTPDHAKGFAAIIGRVLDAKKIFKKEDCATERELKAWQKIQRPIIYGKLEIWDGPDAHDNARAAASIARMLNSSDAPFRLGLSVEGSTLKREGNILKKTIIRGMAATIKPCNRTATMDIVEDRSAPGAPKPMAKHEAAEGVIEPLYKTIDMQFVSQQKLTGIERLAEAHSKLRKTLTAGGTNAAPSSLTQGSALQSESQLGKLSKMFKGVPTRDQLKKALPEANDAAIDKIMAALKARLLSKYESEAAVFYSKFKKQ